MWESGLYTINSHSIEDSDDVISHNLILFTLVLLSTLPPSLIACHVIRCQALLWLDKRIAMKKSLACYSGFFDPSVFKVSLHSLTTIG